MDATEYDTDQSSISYDDKWITHFTDKKENRYLCKIYETFLQDRFNFYGLKEKIRDFEKAYQVIRDQKASFDPEIEADLYYLAHQRYIYTGSGLETVLDRVLNFEFGKCSRVACADAPLLPTGLSNEPRKHGTKLYCCTCNSLYTPRTSLKHLDGCAWGVGYAHFLALSYPYHFEAKPSEATYTPRIFGFRVLKSEDSDQN
ncbi:casein kinase II subunit beta [Pancytospora philotis]|nr:casein kinase II subunit beta [Pancytospora philotis]